MQQGLQNIQQLHAALGHPMDDENKVVVIHIAGTNGKGSVAWKIARTLEAANSQLTIGLFCSPHVSSFRERMQVKSAGKKDRLISEQEVVTLLQLLLWVVRSGKLALRRWADCT